MAEIHKYPTLEQVLARGNDAGSVEITNVDNPTTAQSVATKDYVDNAIPSVPGTTDSLTEGSINLYFTNSRAISAPLTGYLSGAGVISATDTILQAIQKLNGNIASLGSGTVTTVSVVTANGVSGSVSNPTTTPAITLSLGAITPSSVAATGTVTGSNLSGTNTGDNAVNSLYSGLVSNATHTGDATGATALTVVGINGTILSTLATGILKNTTGTGVPSIAVAGTDYQAPITLTTTGTSGAATFIGNVLNIPQYSGGAGLSWGSSISGTSATGLTLTIGSTSAASTTAQTIVFDNTQTTATLYGQTFSYGISTVARIGSYHDIGAAGITALGIYYSANAANQYGIRFTANTGVTIGSSTIGAIDFGVVSTVAATVGSAIRFSSLCSNTGTGYALYVDKVTTSNASASGAAIYINTVTDSSSGGAGKAYGIYIGTVSAANTIARGIHIETIGVAGHGIYIGAPTGTAYSNLSAIYIAAVQGGTGTAYSRWGLYIGTVGTIVSTTNSYGTYISIVANVNCTSYGQYIGTVANASSSTGYGFYVGYVQTAGTGYGFYINNVGGSTAGAGYGMYINIIAGTASQTNAYGIYMNAITNNTSATGYGIYLNQVVGAATATGYGIYISFIAPVTNNTAGYGMYVSTASQFGPATVLHVNNLNAAASTGGNNVKYISLNNAQSAILSGQTTNPIEILHSRTHTGTTGTVTDTFDLFYMKRTSISNGTGGTFATGGSVMKFENVATQTLGTLNDTTDVIKVVQSANSTGVPISITQNRVTSTNFRKVETETNTGSSVWVSNGTTPNGNLSGTAGDVCRNADSGKSYYCTGTTNWTAMGAGTTPAPDVLNTCSTSYHQFYSDNSTYIAISYTTGTSIVLTSGGRTVYRGGIYQSISVTSIYAGSTAYGVIVVGAYLYAFLSDGTTPRVYRCALSSDIATVGNWTLLTISGTALPIASNSGLIGHDGTNFWVVQGGTQYIKYTLSGTTLTSNGTVTVTGANYTYLYDRVNSYIYPYFSTAPSIRIASLTGVLDTTRQIDTLGAVGSYFALSNGYYTSNSGSTPLYLVTI